MERLRLSRITISDEPLNSGLFIGMRREPAGEGAPSSPRRAPCRRPSSHRPFRPSRVHVATGPIYRLTVEAVQLAHAAGVNFANFDSNPNDGVVDHVVIVHAGGAQEASPNTNLIWSHRWAVIDGDPNLPGDQRLVEDSKQIYGYAMISE